MRLLHRFGPAAVLSLPALLLLAVSSAGFAQAGQPQPEPFAGPSGPQQANDEGRTELPMVVRRSLGFREIGPAISGGRVTAVAGIPGKPGTYFVGAADGGIFRTDDGGVTWKALFQHQDTLSIGALAVDPVNPGVIWAGTGEANVRNDVSFGDGIYKSTDGGAHWKHLGLDSTFQISRIVIDPHHPDTVLVAAMGSPWADSEDRGVYRTTDGGATWQKVLYVGPSVGISDLAMNPENPQILFAGAYRYRRTPWSYSDGGPEDAIYKSIDGGTTWRRLSGHGLPEKPVTRIGLAIAPSSPNIVYAVIGSDEGVLWRSDDSGEHWDMVSKDQEVDARPFYFSHLAVDPTDPNHIIALSNNIEESKDGGHSFHPIAHQIHVDYHAIWFDPAGSGRVIDGNDGGIALSRDNGAHWAFIHNIAIGQFYHVSTGSGPFYLVCGGLQDNSAWCGPGRNKNPSGILDRSWFALNGGDGIFAIQAADNPNLFYNSTQNGVWATFDRTTEQSRDMEPYPRDTSGGGVADLPYRFAWDAGFAVSPQDAKVLYAGGNVVFKSEDRGRTWKPISPDLTRNDKAKQQSSGGPVMKDNSGAEIYDAILSITPAESDPKVIWVGTDDGVVQVTRDGGATWKNVTANIPNLPEWGRIEMIDVAPDNPGEAFIAVDRHFSGDLKPYLFRTADYGATWTSIAGNLPAGIYAHVVRRDLRNPHLYYAGLENGLYVSWDSGDHWYLFGLGLPNAAVYDIALDAQQNSLVVGTHGRSLWVLDDLTP
ncbi:MAG: glycosyl hydrolase, partial [Acidobacteriaceae bacterium]